MEITNDIRIINDINSLMKNVLINYNKSLTWEYSACNINIELYNQFLEYIKCLSDELILKTYKIFRNKPPIIIFKDISKYFVKFYVKQFGEKIKIIAKLEINLIKSLLAFSLVVEIGVVNYIERINSHFGWDK